MIERSCIVDGQKNEQSQIYRTLLSHNTLKMTGHEWTPYNISACFA